MKKNITILFSLISVSISLIGCSVNSQNIDNQEEAKKEMVVDLMNDYGAKGDGITSDRAIIQKAIDDVFLNGGGVINFNDNHSFLTGNLLLRSNVELRFGDNTIIVQNPDVNDYIEVRGYDYGNGFVKIGDPFVPYNGDIALPTTGDYANVWPSIHEYREAFHWNYPIFYADKGTENIKIIGGTNTKILMAKHYETCANNIHCNTFGFYGVDGFVIKDITTEFTGGHFMDILCSKNGVIKNITQHTKRAHGIDECRWNDGLHLDRCQNILVDSCNFESGDDALKIGNSYGDVRRDRWASSTEYGKMENIEISNCVCPSFCCGIAFMSHCGTAPDLAMDEMRNVYIHDCKFAGVKIWAQNNLWTPDRSMWNNIQMPIAGLTWLRNDGYYAPEGYHQEISGYADLNWISDCVSDVIEMKSMRTVSNGDFSLGTSYWNFKTTNNSIAIVQRNDDSAYGYLGYLDRGDTRIYEGLYLDPGEYSFTCKERNSKDANVYLFVMDQQDNIIKKVLVNSEVWEDFHFNFEITESKSYRLGLASGTDNPNGSWAMIDDFNVKGV